MKRRVILLLSTLAARKGLATALLIMVNAVHAVIHSTPLDGGALDACIANLDTFAMAAIVSE